MPSPASGKAWLDLDQAALDKAYDQAQWAPNMAQVLQRYAARSALARAVAGPPRRLRYGADDVEALDFFDCGVPGAPVQVFLHGGAWRSGRAHDYAFLVEPLLRTGVHLALPDFAWVQDCGGDLRPLVAQTRRALAWIHANAASLGADPGRLFVAGHSSGAHLAAVLATTDWALHGVPTGVVQGAVLCSGMYELEPVRRSSRSRYLAIDDEALQSFSPIRHLARVRCPLVVAWGALESPEFQRQGEDFASAAQAAGLPVTRLVVDGANHFEVLETMADAAGALGGAVLRQLGRPRDNAA